MKILLKIILLSLYISLTACAQEQLIDIDAGDKLLLKNLIHKLEEKQIFYEKKSEKSIRVKPDDIEHVSIFLNKLNPLPKGRNLLVAKEFRAPIAKALKENGFKFKMLKFGEDDYFIFDNTHDIKKSASIRDEVVNDILTEKIK